MAYRKVNRSSDLTKISLDSRWVDTLYALKDIDEHFKRAGISGVLDTLAKGEHFSRMIEQSNALDLQIPSGDINDLREQREKGRKQIQKAHEKRRDWNKDEWQLSDKNERDIEYIIGCSSHVLRERIQTALKGATTEERKAWIEAYYPLYLEMDIIEGVVTELDEKPVDLVKKFNTYMERVMKNAIVPDEVKHLLEAVYTMATGDIPLTPREAQGKVTSTISLPDRK